MPQYLPVSNEAAGRDLSTALWNLASPPATRSQADVTTSYCNIKEDITGQWYLEIPDNISLPVSPLVAEADLALLVTHIETQEDMLP